MPKGGCWRGEALERSESPRLKKGLGFRVTHPCVVLDGRWFTNHQRATAERSIATTLQGFKKKLCSQSDSGFNPVGTSEAPHHEPTKCASHRMAPFLFQAGDEATAKASPVSQSTFARR